MATQWNLTGSDYIISGTRGSVTEVVAYASAGAFSSGNNMGYYRASGQYNALVIRLTIKPTVKTKSVTFSFTHTNNTNGYSSATGTYYVKASTSANAWPSHTSHDGTSFDLTAAGTKSVTATLSSETSSPFYVYLWAYYDPSGTYQARFVHVTKLSGLTVTANTYPVGYNGNAKSGTTVSGLPSSQTKTAGTNLTLSSTKPTSTSATSSFNITFNANGGSTTKSSQSVTKTQPYTFGGWNTAAGGGGTAYAAGGTYSADAAATLYAQWTAGTATYTKVTMPTTSQCTRTGYTLLGFSTSSTATTATYSPGTEYTFYAADTLYAVWKINTWTVSYNANGGSGAPGSQTKTYGVTLTLSSTKPSRANGSGSARTVTYNGNGGTAGRNSDSVTPVRTYTFSKWNTQSGGGGTDYSPGGSYTANAAMTLYAQWNQSDNSPTVTLPTATRTGYTLLGWATSSGAATAQYAAGASYAVSASVTLYAVWKINTYTVSYNANGGSGAPGNQTKTYGVTLTLSATVPTRTGYSFQGWATSSTATSAAYQPGGSYTANAAATLYAVWKILTYAVEFNANGGSGAPASQTKTYGVTLKLSTVKPTRATVENDTYTVTFNANGGSCDTASATARRRTTYSFLKWNTASGGGGTDYAAGANYTANASATLYAQWEASPGTDAVTLPEAERAGYRFLGWARSAGATAAQYSAGDSYVPTANVTLYAVWQATGLTEIAGGSNFETYQIAIANGSGFDLYQAYVADGAQWNIYI